MTATDTGMTWTDDDVTLRRLPWMSDAQWAKVRDAMVALFAEEGLIPTGLTCPWWCTRTDAPHVAGESEAGGGQMLRIHARGFGDNHLAVAQDELVEDGVTIWQRAQIHVYESMEPESAEEARTIAGWFTDGAALLEQITAAPAEATE